MHRLKYLFILCFFAFLSAILVQPSYFLFKSVELNKVSQVNIYSPKDLTYIDTPATAALEQKALSTVENVYDKDESPYKELSGNLAAFMDEVISTKQKTDQETALVQGKNPVELNEETLSKVTNPFNLKQEEVKLFLELEQKELSRLKKIFSDELRKTYELGITEENLSLVQKNFQNNSIFYLLPNAQTELLVSTLSSRIQPNLILNAKETEKRKKAALKNVDKVYKAVMKGEKIVSEGEKVTEDNITKLEKLGLMNKGFEIKEIFLSFPYFLCIYILFFFYYERFFQSKISSLKEFLFIMFSFSFALTVAGFINDIKFSLIPVLTLLFIFGLFWGKHVTFFSSVTLGLLLFAGDFKFLALSIVAGTVFSFVFEAKEKRAFLIKNGFIVGLSLALTHFAIVYSLDRTLDFDLFIPLVFSGFIAAIIAIGLIPLLENFLGILTHIRLYELNDPNHPLLRDLIQRAPGTYHHSLMVGNLAESAAEAINADGLLLRIGSYFHDVGKLENPAYFIENSSPQDNPHTEWSPEKSAKYILKHPHDSVRMCEEHKVPKAIIDLIASHHGDSVLHHLYEKAKLKNPSVDVSLFQYTTPLPKTKEQSILLLADCTEAYSRVLLEQQVSNDVFEKKIRDMIYMRIERGDLRESALTMYELEIIISVFVDSMLKVNHKRIDYIEA